MTEGIVKKCPECGKEMEKGYVVSEAIKWSNQKPGPVAFGLESVLPWQFLSIPNVEAHRCKQCMLVLFYYGKYTPDKETPKSFLKKCVKCRKEIPIASEHCQYCGAKQQESFEPSDKPRSKLNRRRITR